MQQEIWKDIPEYEGLYQVSNFGRIKGLKREVPNRSGLMAVKETIKIPQINRCNRLIIALSKDGIKKTFLISRIVANAFLDNPNKLPQVNHKDENPYNNRVDNLEWCTGLYNTRYGTGIKRRAEKQKKPIIQINKFTKEKIRRFSSLIEAEKITGVNHKYISAVICKKKQTAGGYIWELENPSDKYRIRKSCYTKNETMKQ